ncbi:acid-sensing ion channel 1A [Hydra vulgaris]|uniref:Acid-sensing ion channel 1A n=1 Tax=Hydra vulgaris TaxID=6087 RepID=A0ABM4BH90_HYDVU
MINNLAWTLLYQFKFNLTMSQTNSYTFRAFHRAQAMKNAHDGSILIDSPEMRSSEKDIIILKTFARNNNLPFSIKFKKQNDNENNKILSGHAPETNNNVLNGKTNVSRSAGDRFRAAGMKARFARRMEKIVEERMTVKQIFNRYVQTSTLHGFRFIFMDTFIVRRVLWTILTLTMATIFFKELRNSINLFYEYPFTTTSTIQYEPSLTFPAISVCNLNHFLLSKIKKSKLKPLYDQGRLPFDNNLENPGFDIQGDELYNILKTSSQSIDEIFLSCEWKSRDTAKNGVPNPCKPNNFTVYSGLYGQSCYTFNPGVSGYPLLSLSETGVNMGFKLELDLKSKDSLQGIQEIGAIVIVHHQQETPVLQAGFVVSPGFQTFVEIKVRQTENLPPPYATKCGSKPLKNYQIYRQSSCFLEQLSDAIETKCKCKSSFMAGRNIPYCSLRQTVTCLMPTIYDFDRKTNNNCPVDCETIQYLSSLSYARFISNVTYLSKNAEQSSYIRKLKNSMSPKKLQKYIEENIVAVQFFYQEMKKEKVKQEPSYDFYKLIGDVGGQLGLLLGASVLTLVEFVDLFIFTLYHQLLRLSKKKS